MTEKILFNRRRFLYLSALSLAAAGGLSAAKYYAATPQAAVKKGQRLLVSGYRDKTSQSRFGILTSDCQGHIVSDFAVPYRIHMADLFPAQPQQQTAILANSRAPGAPLQKYSLNGTLLAELMPPEQMHFEGHTVFSDDGRLLYATASHYTQQQGYVLEVDCQTFTLQRLLPSGGIGPHELVISHDQLFVANTGVLTHPDSGRQALNIDSMESSLVQLDISSGTIVHRWHSPIQALSARHLAIMADGSLLLGCQYQKKDQRPACLALAQPGATQLTLLGNDNERYYWDMKGYTASVTAFDKHSPLAGQALISNPRGHILSQWQPADGTLLSSQTMPFSKGIVVADTEGWITAGAGELWHWDGLRHQLVPVTQKIKADFWWENHLYGRVI